MRKSIFEIFDGISFCEKGQNSYRKMFGFFRVYYLGFLVYSFIFIKHPKIKHEREFVAVIVVVAVLLLLLKSFNITFTNICMHSDIVSIVLKMEKDKLCLYFSSWISLFSSDMIICIFSSQRTNYILLTKIFLQVFC